MKVKVGEVEVEVKVKVNYRNEIRVNCARYV